MGAVKINGTTSGSVSLEAPATGSDVTLTLPDTTMNLGTELASKLPIAGGKILQVVRATDTTQRSTTSTSFVDANISVTITPQKSDSAIFLLYSAYVSPSSGGASSYLVLQITDNSNNAISGSENNAIGSVDAIQYFVRVNLTAWATPATTSATTYKVRHKVDSGGVTSSLRNHFSTGQLYAIEVSA